MASPPNLVEQVIFGGADENRAVTVFPATNVNGAAVITVVVTDEAGAHASTSFTLTVNAVQPPPTIVAIPDQTALDEYLHRTNPGHCRQLNSSS